MVKTSKIIIETSDICRIFDRCPRVARKIIRETKEKAGLEDFQFLTVDDFLKVHSNFNRQTLESIIK